VPAKKVSYLLAAGLALAAVGASRAEAEDASLEQARDRTLSIERLHFNLLANASFASRAASENLPLPQWLSVAAATDTAPIEIATPIAHGLTDGDTVLIKGVSGNTAANGWWTITIRTPTTFALEGSDGNGSYAGGGSVFPAAGQPPPPGPADERGELGWTPWYSGPAVFPQTEFFHSDGVHPTGEVYTFPNPAPATSFLSQGVAGSLFRPGERLCLSIEARMADRAPDAQRLTLFVTTAFASVKVYTASYPATLLTPEYRRFSLCFTLDSTPIPEDSVVWVEFVNEVRRRGPSPAMYWTRPLLNEGAEPIPWTPNVQPLPRTHAFY
jgi:hypothetical protein